MAERAQVLERLPDAASLIREDDVRDRAGDLAVEEHDRARDRREQRSQVRVVLVDEREDERVDTSGHERLEREPLPGRLPARADDHEADAVAAELPLEHLGDAAEDVIADRRHEEPDQQALRRPQAARRGVDAIVESRGRLEHARPRRRRDVGRAVENAGRRRLRDRGLARDVENRRLPVFGARATLDS